MVYLRRRDGGRRRANVLPEALFETLWARFQQEPRRDPALRDFTRRRRMFSMTRLGHLLTYQQGLASAIGAGEMRWKPTMSGQQATSYRFTVRRSTLDPSMLQIVDGHGPSSEMTLAGVVDAIVRIFIEQTAAHQQKPTLSAHVLSRPNTMTRNGRVAGDRQY